jgi:uncharacterized glyoxalase superfamily protein PhnB
VGREAPPADFEAELRALLGVASGLRDLPREEFKTSLRQDLERRAKVSTATASEQKSYVALQTVTPYITTQKADELIEFVKSALGAEEVMRATGSAGGLHCEVKIADSRLMIGGGPKLQHHATPTAIHLYVRDADATYRRAIEAGASSLMPPTDMNYGDREASVQDLAGNRWYFGTVRNRQLPEGTRAATLYLHPRGADEFLEFLKQAFGAQAAEVFRDPKGTIVHAQVRIGNSVVEMGEAHGQWSPMPTMIYLQVDDADAAYERALRAGATSISAPADQPYGARSGAVQDSQGNQWHMAAPLK